MEPNGALLQAQQTGSLKDQQSFFAACFNTFYSELLSIAYSYRLANPEDVVSEVFLKIQRRGVQGLKPTNLRGLFIQATHNYCKTVYARRKFTEEISEEGRGGYSPLDGIDRWIDFQGLLSTLKEEEKAAIVWQMEGYKLAEIAQKLGKKEGATKMLVKRAKKKLKEIYMDHES